MRYAVQHQAAGEGWVNAWLELVGETALPVLFETEAEADHELRQFLAERPHEDPAAYRVEAVVMGLGYVQRTKGGTPCTNSLPSDY